MPAAEPGHRAQAAPEAPPQTATAGFETSRPAGSAGEHAPPQTATAGFETSRPAGSAGEHAMPHADRVDPAESLEGLEPEARAAVNLAARKAGLPPGSWLTQAILNAATSEFKQEVRPQSVASSHLPPALTTEALLENIQKLTRRIEEAEAKTAETIAPLAKTVSDLSEQIKEVGTTTAVSTAPLERALSRFHDRLEKLEEVTTKVGGDFFRRLPLRWVLAVAVALVLLAGAGWTFLRFN
jgi:phosphoglycolate phosphatase-like HAD superfamily hydrolase